MSFTEIRGKRVLRRYLFANLHIDEVCRATWSGNVRMARVAEKCGFTVVARRPGKCAVRGEKHDALTFDLFRECWEEMRGGAR